MINIAKPPKKPTRPCFSSGPCVKRPGWSLRNLDDAAVGRSHRSKIGKAKLAEVINRTRTLLGVPDDYRIGVVPASDTGAVEMALWSLLGARAVDILAWESFGQGWITDVKDQLKLKDVRILEAEYGEIPDFDVVESTRDVVFTWNGTTSGVRVPDGDWISDHRGGLTICDATSAVFAQSLPWSKLDVVTYSWQKVMGGEAAHGMLILSPRAVERLETYTPPWPLPKIFRLTKAGRLIEGIFTGATINTPSMLCVEDYLDALKWAEEIGGLTELFRRADGNLQVIAKWVEKTPWIEFLAKNATTRSNTSVCLKVVDPQITSLSDNAQAAFVKQLASKLEAEHVAYDIEGYRDAPPGLRIWVGATVDAADLEVLLPWLDWAFALFSAKLVRSA